ncbi:MAG: DUF4124 domain-containing protein [Pseudomonadales bacterium]|jgi:hypothetical protein|nr:DUF4124 domain-containing protein [Pseudomonadales bacterium]
MARVPTSRTIVLGILTLLVLPALAAPIYRTRDESGNPVFTDRPQGADAERVDVAPSTSNVYRLPEAVPATDPGTLGDEELGTPEADPAATPSYTVFVEQPGVEEAVRANGGNVTVLARVEPQLREGDRFELLWDGEPRGTSRDGSFQLEAVDRGEHRVAIRVVGADGAELARSDAVTFYVLRRSVLLPPGN